MGSRGPIPKRDAARAGHATKASAADRVAAVGRVEQPLADEAWSDYARGWYDSLATSAQARYFEPSDWQHARLVALSISIYERSSRPSSEMLKAILSGMAELGTTEGARRRQRIEIDRALEDGEAEADARVAVDAQLRRLGAVAP